MLYIRAALLGHLAHALVAPPRLIRPRLHLASSTTEVKGDSVTETLARSVQIGAVGGTIIAGFRKCVDTLHGDVFFKGLSFDVCAKDPKFIIGPVIGALVVGKALQGGKTVAQLKDVTLRREPLKKRDQVTRGAAAALTLGSGCSLGPEGPCVELGAATGQWAASQGGKPNALAAAGVAAGVAAGFDAPTAAVAFALESDTKNADATAAVSAITAAGVASYVSRTLLRGAPTTTRKGSKGLAAVVTNWKLFDVGPLMSVAQDVVIASFVAAVFAKALRTSADLFKKAPSINDSLDAARAAAITGAITLAVGSPMILFWHSAPFKAALAGSLSRNRVLTLAAAKVAATGACVSSPLVGGLFAPTLILGALGGAAVSPTVARYAAAACLGAFFGTPVTGALLVAELLKAPALVLPSLIAAVLARALLKSSEE
jgi:H+/Cl- antiporter ClcA